jgi:hypothetical protein
MNPHALITLWNLTQEHPGTSGARAAAGVLLSLYNGQRFQLDLTDLRVLDCKHLRAALQVMEGDANRCQMEVHEWLNRLTGRRDFGERFEHLAHDYACFKRGRCTVANLAKVEPLRLPIQVPPEPNETDPAMKALRQLHSVCLGMDLENQMQRPTEDEYQEAMAAAAVVVAP